MRPVNQQILVRPFESDEMSAGGLFVPDSCRDISNKVEIVEVGDGSKKCPMRFEKGQVGFRIKDSGTEILIEGIRHFLIHQNYLLATLN